MKLYFPITVDLYNIYPLPTMNIQQHNIGRGALVTLTAAGQLIVPTAEQLYIYAKKKDGTLVYASCTLSGDQIKVDYDEQMAAVPGIMQMELQMVDGRGNSITTPIFQVNVQKTNIDYRGVTSSDEFTALIDALNKVGNIENINKQISDMEKNIGTISGLTTTEKGSLVGAINEIDRDVGNLQQLQTKTKTNMVDAVNELNGKMNSNPWSKLERTNNLEEVFSKPPGIYFHDCQDATDNPLKGTMTLSITAVLNERWGMQYILSSHRMRNRDKSGGVLTEWRVMIQLS